MSWVTQTFSSSIGRKAIMSLTGLFLISFLTVHMSGNLLLFQNDDGLAFNAYAKFMTTNPVIKTVSYLLYTGIIVHSVWALILSVHNRSVRPVGYAVSKASANSSWNSRNMGILGTIVLVFLIIHMRSFWYEMKFGSLPLDANGNKDLYSIVQAAFQQWWYALLYVVAMGGLAFHLAHGFASAFQTLGLNHRKYTPLIQKIGLAFAVIVPFVFATMPIYFYIKSLI